jgi:hypothetical protein
MLLKPRGVLLDRMNIEESTGDQTTKPAVLFFKHVLFSL